MPMYEKPMKQFFAGTSSVVNDNNVPNVPQPFQTQTYYPPQGSVISDPNLATPPMANQQFGMMPMQQKSMPALAQTMSLEEKERKLLPKQGSIGTTAPTKGVKTGVIRPTMSIEMVSKPVTGDTATKTYNVMTQGTRLQKLLSDAPDAGINIMKGKAVGGTLRQQSQ